MEQCFIANAEDPLIQVFMKHICHQSGVTYPQDRNALVQRFWSRVIWQFAKEPSDQRVALEPCATQV